MTSILVLGDIHADINAISRIVQYVSALGPDVAPTAVLLTGDFVTCAMPHRKVTPRMARAVVRAVDIVLDVLGVPVFCVPGNHDDPDLWNADTSIRNVDVLRGNAPAMCDGFRILGVGGSWSLGGFPYEWSSEDDVFTAVMQIDVEDRKREILLTHAPPRGCKVDTVATGETVGSAAIHRVIRERSPLLCVCGHIHEAAGWGVCGSSYVMNAGALSAARCTYRSRGGPTAAWAVDSTAWSACHFAIVLVNDDGEPPQVLEAFEDPDGWKARRLVLRDGRVHVVGPQGVHRQRPD